MTMKQAVSLVLGASLCLPLAACGAEEKPKETTQAVYAETTAVTSVETTIPVTIPETAQAPALPETTVPTEPLPEPEDDALVRIADYIPGIHTELKYATSDNFTGQVIYGFQDAYLRYGTVKKLMAAQESFQEIGLSLKIWDAFRPVSAQFTLWEVCPDDTYVADPRKGYSNHSRGNAVDVTLVDGEGNEIEMPTAFDDFSGKADRNYADCTKTAAENATLMQDIMERYGFKGYYGEWWHFADEVRYEVETSFDPA